MFRNLSEKVKTESWLLNQKNRPSRIFFYLLILFLPTQLGKHFWPDFSFVYGVRVDYLSPTFYFTDLIIIFLCFFWIFESRKKIKIKFNIKIFLFLSLFLFLILGISLSKSPGSGLYGLVKLLEFLILFFYTAKNFRNLNKKIIFSTIFAGVLFESLLSLAQYVSQSSLNGIFYFFGERSFNSQTPGVADATLNGQLVLRPYGTFPHPNVLAAYLYISLYSLLLIFPRIEIKFKKLFLWLILAIGTIALFATLSRIVIFVWACSALSYLIFLFWKKTRIGFLKKINYVFLFLILIFIVLSFFTIPVFQRFAQTSFSDESLVQREQLVNDSLEMYGNNPLFGTGLNNFLINLPSIEKKQKQSFYLQPVHNIFLLALSELGIPGFLYLSGFVVYVFLKIRKQKKLLILFSGIIALGLFDHYFFTLQQGQILFSLTMGAFLSSTKKIG